VIECGFGFSLRWLLLIQEPRACAGSPRYFGVVRSEFLMAQ